MRIAPSSGVLGFDLSAMLSAGQAIGISEEAIVTFLPYVERGMRAGLAAVRDGEEQETIGKNKPDRE